MTLRTARQHLQLLNGVENTILWSNGKQFIPVPPPVPGRPHFELVVNLQLAGINSGSIDVKVLRRRGTAGNYQLEESSYTIDLSMVRSNFRGQTFDLEAGQEVGLILTPKFSKHNPKVRIARLDLSFANVQHGNGPEWKRHIPEGAERAFEFTEGTDKAVPDDNDAPTLGLLERATLISRNNNVTLDGGMYNEIEWDVESGPPEFTIDPNNPTLINVISAITNDNVYCILEFDDSSTSDLFYIWVKFYKLHIASQTYESPKWIKMVFNNWHTIIPGETWASEARLHLPSEAKVGDCFSICAYCEYEVPLNFPLNSGGHRMGLVLT